MYDGECIEDTFSSVLCLLLKQDQNLDTCRYEVTDIDIKRYKDFL